MPTAKSTKRAKKDEKTDLGQFIDRIIENQGRLSEALAAARQRGTKIVEMMSDQVVQGQREALELAKLVATNPSAYTENSKAMLDAAIESQNRGLDFAKELYKEQAAAAENLRESMQSVMESSREAAESAMELGRSWSLDNPMSGAWQRSLDSLRN